MGGVFPQTRQLGPSQAGVQLNPIRDTSGGAGANFSDQSLALVGRFKRGRIDKAFRVNSGNLSRLLGAPESTRLSSLNEAYVQLAEALNNGAYDAVVSRLVPAAASHSYAVFNVVGNVSAFSVAAAIPSANYLFYIKHLGCFNDGIKLEVAALAAFASDGITPVASKMITLRVFEPNGSLLYQFTGSLDPAAVHPETGEDAYLGAIISDQTDEIIFSVAPAASIPITADCYGKDANGMQKTVATANPLVLFSEGGTGYNAADYDKAVAALEASDSDFGYLVSAGTQSTALLMKMARLAYRINRQFLFDVPGNLTPPAAIAFVRQLGLDSHYCQCYWAPLSSKDGVNGGRAIIGSSAYNAARRCARNAAKNASGLARKHEVVAGEDWPLVRNSIKQLYVPNDFELNDLAANRINPVIFQSFDAGGKFVFADSLTLANTSSLRKLMSTAEISADLDEFMARTARSVLQQPIDTAIVSARRAIKKRLEAMEYAGWIIPSEELGGASYVLSLSKNPQSPFERIDMRCATRCVGTARVITIEQQLSRP